MRKIVLLISIALFVVKMGYSQPPQYPINQYLGAPNTLVTSRGGLKADSSLILPSFKDTAFANRSTYIKKYAGSLIRVGDDLWIRDSSATRWIQISNNQSVINTYYGTQLIYGDAVWSSGLTFNITPSAYYILGRYFTAQAGSITLNAADPTNPRIDVIYLDTLGQIGKITGVPSANPSKPVVNPLSQIELTHINLPAGATTPGGITSTLIYNENTQYPTEWNTATNAPGTSIINFNYTINPYSGTKSVFANNQAQKYEIQFKRPTVINADDYTILSMFFRLNSGESPSPYFYVTLRNSSVDVTEKYIATAIPTVGSYQQVAFQMSNFVFTTRTREFNEIIITMIPSVTSGTQFDFITLQSGGNPPPVVSNYWSLNGNDISSSPSSKLGTTSSNSLAIITSDITRISIDSLGVIKLPTIGSSSDTTTYKPVGINPTTKQIINMTDWGAASSSGKYIDSLKRSSDSVYAFKDKDWYFQYIDSVNPNYWTRSNNYIYPATITDSVGIGTSSPDYTLDISGSLRTTKNTRLADDVTQASKVFIGRTPTSGSYTSTIPNLLTINGSYGLGLSFIRPTDFAEMVALSVPDQNTLKIGGQNQAYVDMYTNSSKIIRLANGNPYMQMNTTTTLAAGAGNTTGIELSHPITSTGANSSTITSLNIKPTYNQSTFGTGTIRGIYYNPTVTELNSSPHYAIETTSGELKFANISTSSDSSTYKPMGMNTSGDVVRMNNWITGGGGGGSGTVISVATGYGLSGGTITTSGTLLVDTATLSTKYVRVSDNDTIYTTSPIMTTVSNDSTIVYFNADTANAWRGNGTVTSVTQLNDSTITVVNNGATNNYIIRSSIAGSATRLVTSVYNNSGATITKGSVVYINGAHSSNLPTVALAKANAESTSAFTYGLIETDIANNNAGVVIQSGTITNLNLPTSTYTDGQTLYLSPTVAGGYTLTKPIAPNHYVAIGTITRAHPTQGTIQIAIRNGFQLDEMSDVQIPIVPNDSNLLQFSIVDSLWHAVGITNAIGSNYIKPSDTATMLSPYVKTNAISSGYLSSDATTTNLTATNTNLTFSIAANETWRIMIAGTAKNSTTGQVKIAIGAPTGCTMRGIVTGGGATMGSSTINQALNAVNTLSAGFATGNNVEVAFRFEGVVVNGANAGSITLQFAAGTTGTATIYNGTLMQWTRTKPL